MDTSPVGIAAALVAMQAGAMREAVQTAMIKNQAKSAETVLQLIEAADLGRSAAPPGQGGTIDRRA
jgi:hypothetical protein